MFTNIRAPSLYKSEPVWGEQIKLFDGIDLKGWHTSGKNQWVAQDGIISPASG